ncbi:sigma-70 family RNA polymerase sigma factor [Listeria monocytogenes]|nr:sigma-70 family RNA polymerase sigma factor [Listeria monocytogenes]EHW6679209.1 sigma-70 family RNA polymerase sigma factor [Listeria monocytogenes]
MKSEKTVSSTYDDNYTCFVYDSYFDSESEELSNVKSGLLSEVFNVLTEREKDCYRLKYVSGFSYIEIANSLGITTNTVRNMLSNSRKKLEAAKSDSLIIFELGWFE